MPYGDMDEKPLTACEVYHIEKLTCQKTEEKRANYEIKLVKRDPILTAILPDASFEETLDDISKQRSKTQGKQDQDHHRESFEVRKTKKIILAC